LKQILVTRLYVNAKYNRNFERLVDRIKEAGGEVAVSDYATLPGVDSGLINNTYSGVVLSGTEALLTRTADRALFSELIVFVPKITIPILGVSGGHHVLALAYGGRLSKSSRLIQGFRTVTLEDKDTLLAGLPHKIRVLQSHAEQVKQLPASFIRTATSSDTENEGMKHESLPLYGVQFHPERWNEESASGRRVLENFVQRIAIR
jgi:GMP synthase-like glutamine amidotransferase